MHINTKRIITIIGLVFFLCTPRQLAIAASGRTTRISVSSSMVQANFWSMNPAISADGRFIVFDSTADNLVDNDTNGSGDVFLRDRHTGQTTRVSLASDGTEGDEHSFRPAISDDGNVIAFVSLAINLVPDDTNQTSDIFVHTCSTGETKRISVASNGDQANGASDRPAISGDGRFVAFTSAASNLVSNDSNNVRDIFVHDLQDGITTRVSVDSLGEQANANSWFWVAISEDGRYVAFASDADNLVSGDTNGSSDIFRHDRITGETIRVSLTFEGSEANFDSINPSISADGNLIAFESYATNLVSGITNWYSDIFVRDVLVNQTTRVSLSSNMDESNDNSFFPKISADGRFVSFKSFATNLVDGDTNGFLDIFTHDRLTGVTNRVSVSSLGTEANGHSFYGHDVSADGRFVTFGSEANNLVYGDTNGVTDVFLHDQYYEVGDSNLYYLPLILKP